MVDLQYKGDLVRILAGHRGQYPQGRGYGVAAALDGQLDDVFRIEIYGVRRKRRRRCMFDSLVHRQDRKVAGTSQPAVIKHGRQRAEHIDGPIAGDKDAVQKIRAGQVQGLFGKTFAGIGQQGFRLVA